MDLDRRLAVEERRMEILYPTADDLEVAMNGDQLWAWAVEAKQDHELWSAYRDLHALLARSNSLLGEIREEREFDAMLMTRRGPSRRMVEVFACPAGQQPCNGCCYLHGRPPEE